MPRIRTIKPEHWNDRELPNISLQAHLLWIGMWNFSDDKGIIDADTLLMKSQIFPRRTEIRTADIDQWIGQLVKARFIIPFTHEGQGYYIHRTFDIHQRIDKPQPSKFDENFIKKVFLDSKNVPRTLPPVLEGKGKESKGGERPPAIGLVLNLKDFEKEIRNSFQIIEAAARRNKTTPAIIVSMIPAFIDTCIQKGKNSETWQEYCNYFSNWLLTEFSKNKDKPPVSITPPSKPKPRYTEEELNVMVRKHDELIAKRAKEMKPFETSKPQLGLGDRIKKNFQS